MQYSYLLINLAVISIPLSLTVLKAFGFYKTLMHVFKTIIMVGIPFILWDIGATYLGHWQFIPMYLTGLTVINLPIEEWLFFFAIPYSCLFLAFLSHQFSPKRSLSISREMIYILLLLLFIIIGLYWNKTYTVIITLMVLLVLITWLKNDTSATLHIRLWLVNFFGISFVFFMIVNSILSGLPIVQYSAQHASGIRVGTIPIEDFGYNFLLLLSLVKVYFGKLKL